LLEIELVEKYDYDNLCESIKENKDEWFNLMERYDDPEEDNPFYLY